MGDKLLEAILHRIYKSREILKDYTCIEETEYIKLYTLVGVLVDCIPLSKDKPTDYDIEFFDGETKFAFKHINGYVKRMTFGDLCHYFRTVLTEKE